jgi:FKBP-type peptidyl-prolyl cis-trans isomerase FklB
LIIHLLNIHEKKGMVMKLLSVFLLSLVLLSGCDKGAQQGGADAKLESNRDSVSYSIGINIGMNMLRDSVEFNAVPLLRGLSDAALDTSKRLMKPAEVEQTLMAYQQELTQKRMESARVKGEANLKRGEEWLAENAKKAGVVVLPSGLQYKIIKNGTGPKPKKEQYVTAHYRGSFVDGKQFDSSIDRKEPATFQLTGVIPGWTEGLQLMPVGSKWEFYIPAKLGYGEQGSGPIGPNETLIFEVELLSIK